VTAAGARETELAAAYERARPRLVSVAYAVLGSHSEAEDVVSDCWLRLVAADARESVRDIEAWATITVARAALDTARSARRRREVYVGPWLPEPVVGRGGEATASDPADRISLDDTIRYALLVVLESLSPAERTAWVLHDLFGLPFGEIAEAVGRTPAAVRQLASRARAHVNAHAPRVDVSRGQHDAAVRSFISAAAGGDLSALIEALDPDVVLTSDGGGEVTAALRPVLGADKVGRLLVGLLNQLPPCAEIEPVVLNGELGIGIVDDTGLSSVVAFTFDGGLITRIDMIRSPRKLPGGASSPG
jgi:RNA polymerase sigma-70 factor (ECF subfamily)